MLKSGKNSTMSPYIIELTVSEFCCLLHLSLFPYGEPLSFLLFLPKYFITNVRCCLSVVYLNVFLQTAGMFSCLTITHLGALIVISCSNLTGVSHFQCWDVKGVCNPGPWGIVNKHSRCKTRFRVLKDAEWKIWPGHLCDSCWWSASCQLTVRKTLIREPAVQWWSELL